MQIELNFHYIGFFLICSLAVFGVYYRWRCVQSHINMPEERQDVRMICFFLLIGLAVFLSPCILYGMKISYTKLNYITPPFSYLGVKTAGPELSDVADQNLPHLWKAFIQHEFTLWNKDVAFGTQTDLFFVLNPLNWVFLLGMELGQLLKTILEYTIAFLGLFLFLRRCRLCRESAFIGAISYCFCSVMVMWNGWPHSDVMAFGPWLFYFAESMILEYHDKSHIRIGNCIGFTMILYLMLISGMPTYVPFFIYSGFAYFLLRSVQLFDLRTEMRIILALLFVLIICIMIAGLMSFAYTGAVLFRTQAYQEERMSFSFATLAISYFRTLFFPYYREGLTIHPNECTMYVGPLIAFCIPALLARSSEEKKQRNSMVFWACVVFLSFLLIFVRNTGCFYQYIPGLNSSNKFRAIALFCFSASLLSAYIVEAFTNIHEKRKQWTAATLVVLTPVMLLLVYGYTADLKIYYLLFSVVSILLLLVIFLKQKTWLYALCLVCTVCMSVFAQKYTPMIDQNAEIIPPETESILYLENHLKGGERILSLGTWNFFPHSNMYYDIEQICAHSFVNTNQDMRNYLTAIDPTAYSKSPTFTFINKLENPNLLSYASVKYLLSNHSSQAIVDDLIRRFDTRRNAYVYNGETTLEQHFIAQAGMLSGVTFLLSTGRQELSADDMLDLSLIRVSDREIVAEAMINLSTVQNNKMHTVKWDNSVPCSEGEEYIIRLSSDHVFHDPLAFWITEASIYDGDLSIDGIANAGDISLLPAYNKIFSDGETIEEIGDYAPRAYFADSIRHLDSYDAVLEEMKTQFYPNTAIITDDDWSKLDLVLSETEQQVSIRNYSFKNDRINMDLNADAGGMVVITDYYDPEWRVSVNGKESELVKTNYLFMGVPIPEAGEYHVEFRYVPASLYFYFAVSAVGFALFAGMIIFRKNLEMRIDRKIGATK